MVGDNIEVFRYAPLDARVRVVLIDGDPWWVAVDACRPLGIVDPKSSLRLLDDDEKGVHTVHTPGGDQRVSIISEAGLYSLILRSRKPEARAFKRWITHEVIPSIRKTGTYTMPSPGDDDTALLQQSRKFLLALTDRVEELEEVNAELTDTIEEQQPKADFYDRLTAANGFYTMQEAAQILGTGRNRLFRQLRDRRILQATRNLPYQQFKEAGYFEVKTTVRVLATGQDVPDYRVYVTAKGLDYLRKRLAEGLW